MRLKNIALTTWVIHALLILINIISWAALGASRTMEIVLLVISIGYFIWVIIFLVQVLKNYRRHPHYKLFLTSAIMAIIFFIWELNRYLIFLIALSNLDSLGEFFVNIAITFLLFFWLYIIILFTLSLIALILFIISWVKLLKDKGFQETKAEKIETIKKPL